MDVDLSPEAVEFGRTATRAIQAAGGDALVRAAEADPSGREALVDAPLRGLGAWDLAPRRSSDEMEAAAALCRAAGHAALPYPVAERLARPADIESDGLVVVSDRSPAAALAATSMCWTAVTTDGHRSTVQLETDSRTVRQSAFVVPLALEAIDDHGSGDVALALTLPCWSLLGMLDRALEMTREYLLGRKQFGQPLARFQGLQFQLTEAEVERAGLAELAKYTLWSCLGAPEVAIDDALALRMVAVEAAETVFRIAHQLHGAIGFCDETTLSWLSRYSQPVRRLPFGLSATRELLANRIEARGLTGLFEVGAADASTPVVEPDRSGGPDPIVATPARLTS